MANKKCCETNTFGGAGGFEGLERGMKKGKVGKPFPTYEDAEKEVKKVPRNWY
jgi:hypothetical protein